MFELGHEYYVLTPEQFAAVSELLHDSSISYFEFGGKIYIDAENVTLPSGFEMLFFLHSSDVPGWKP